jgi:hypothetical protein
MTTPDFESLALDLFGRTEREVEKVAHLSVDTEITFQVEDIVDAVERGLPEGYPGPVTGAATRRDMIRRMARDILSGDAYEDD